MDQRRAKGLVGQLMELALGADAGNKDQPDFLGLDVELKTIPLRRDGRPKESTYVCSISLPKMADREWEDSIVWRKLKRVCFVPIESERAIPLPDRRVGGGFIWSPTDDEVAALRADWERLAAMIARGQIDEITAHLGDVLQVRPKAPNAAAKRMTLDTDGAPRWANPRGFYLRARFTEQIVARALA